MNLLAIEILLAAFALKRGWRITPVVLFALPIAVHVFEASLAGLLAGWLGEGRALAHAVALVGLIVTCWTGPAELPSRVLGSSKRRRAGPLYQI